MNAKEKKAKYMKNYHKLRKENGGKKLGGNYGRRWTDMKSTEFSKRFMVGENG